MIVRAHDELPALSLPINNALPSCAHQQRDPLASVESGAPTGFGIKPTLGHAVDPSTSSFRVYYLVWGCALEVGWVRLGRRAVEVKRLMECPIVFTFIIDF